jgi:hypothetical protein
MTAEGAGTSISSLDAHFLKLRRYAELGSIRSLKVPLGEDVSSEVGPRDAMGQAARKWHHRRCI